jgi:alkylation response protein AidB-like acyl-CoA dehydrogenase
MDKMESLNHTKWDCKYHVVFIPKNRRKVLYAELRKYLGEVFRSLALQKDLVQPVLISSTMAHDTFLRDAGRPCLKEAAMAKLFASEMAEKVCSAAIQTQGGYGYVSDFPVERIYRDVRVCQIYQGTSDVQKIIIQGGLA